MCPLCVLCTNLSVARDVKPILWPNLICHPHVLKYHMSSQQENLQARLRRQKEDKKLNELMEVEDQKRQEMDTKMAPPKPKPKKHNRIATPGGGGSTPRRRKQTPRRFGL